MIGRHHFVPGPAYAIAVGEIKRNAEQEAVFNAAGHVAVLAGPGSGKTKVLTTTIARILADDLSPPFRIACISYNNECVRELRRRLEALGAYDRNAIFVGTMHAFCFSQILIPFGRIAGLALKGPLVPLTDAEHKALFASALKIGFPGNPPPKPDLLLRAYRRDRALGRDLAKYSDNDARFARAYELGLLNAGKVDPDGMITWAVGLFRRHEWLRTAVVSRFPVFAIDEYQDFAPELDHFAQLVLDTHKARMIVVGDADQSIYGFQGADPSLLTKMAARPEFTTVRLRFNYRSGSRIINAAEAALGSPRDYVAADARVSTLDIYGPRAGLQEEAHFILDELITSSIERFPGRTLGDCAILYIDKNDGDLFAAEASKRGIKFQRVDGGAAYKKSRIARLLEECAAWCGGGWKVGRPRLSGIAQEWGGIVGRDHLNKERASKRAALVRFMVSHRVPDLSLHTWLLAAEDAFLHETRDLPELIDDRKQVETVMELAKPGNALGNLTVREFGGQRGSPDHLNLMTLHSSKGLEFDVVLIPGVDNGRIPSWSADTEAKRQESRRLFYVGITRAKNEVHLTYSGFTQDKFGRIHANGRSDFLEEIERRIADT